VESIPADLVHHFLLALCTHTGTGLCFKDRGWYPWKDEENLGYEDEDEEKPVGFAKKSKTYNRIIGNLLKNLKPTEDARQQELALKIFVACPELVSP
jgi:nucleolar pre-ribosomal-associated protein 1